MQTGKRIVLIQPGYPYGRPQTYLPGSLLNLGARLMQVGFEVDLLDLNRTDMAHLPASVKLGRADYIGITVLGTPYIPEVRRIIQELRRRDYAQPILIGGEGIARVGRQDLERIFANLGDVRTVQHDGDLRLALDLKLVRLPSKFETSMVPMLERLSGDQLRAYLTAEFCLFFSHGCAYNCDFCAAAKKQKEEYRNLDPLLQEVAFIAAFLKRIGHPTMSVYLSNLDALQTPEQLELFLQRAHETAAKHGITLRARALATTHFTARALRRDPAILQRLHRHGLYMLGFGVDGVTDTVWRRQNKGHNTLSDLEFCIAECRAAQIEPEALMVIGLPGETLQETFAGIAWSLKQAYLHKLAIRAYLGKSGAPGSKAWSEDRTLVERFLRNPELFLNMEYTMFASKATHSNPMERRRANLAYALLLGLLLPTAYTTPPLIPLPRHPVGRRIAEWFNQRMPLDR